MTVREQHSDDQIDQINEVNEVRWRVLGVPEVLGTPALPAGRQSVVLCRLLVQAPHAVSIEALVDAVWGQDPPASARTQIHICISRLRKALAGVGSPLVTRHPGYALEIDRTDTDLGRFRAMTEVASLLRRDGRPESAAREFRRALRLWRGNPFDGVDSEVLGAEAAGLVEERAVAVESALELEVSMGAHAEVLGELAALVQANPLREALRYLLMLALHRCGRQADALAVYRQGREHLAVELGLDPDRRLRDLEQAILEGGPAVDGPAAAKVPTWDALPAEPASWVGRTREVARAVQDLRRPEGPRAVVVSGGPGSGLTGFGARVARELAPEFPDGTGYLDLDRSSGESLDARIDAARDSRSLVVIDGVGPDEDLERLTTGTGPTRFLVLASSRSLALPTAHRLELGDLGEAEGLELLAATVGPERIEVEPGAARGIVTLLQGHPQALGVLAARLESRPHLSLSGVLTRLRSGPPAVLELEYGRTSVRRSLTRAWELLPERDRKVLTLLAGCSESGHRVPAWVAAVATGEVQRFPADAVDRLLDRHLVRVQGFDVAGEPWLQVPHVVGQFASGRLSEVWNPGEFAAARRRVANTSAWLSQVPRPLVAPPEVVLHPGYVAALRGVLEVVQRPTLELGVAV